MAKTRVLVVDDSLTMRALVAGMLEKDKDIEVVGLADGANEARQMVRDLKPMVMTLDVEMPGMSGIEYLAEIMEKDPMPVIMFSTLTAKGAESSIDALRLGAIDCYPKPTRATPDEVQAVIGKLGKTVKDAPARFAAMNTGAADAAGTKPVSTEPFAWNGKLVTIGADIASTKPLFDLLAKWPADGPPVIVVQHMRPDLADGMFAKLGATIAPTVVEARDGLALDRGMVVVTRPGDRHIYVDQWPGGTIRLLDKPTFAGQRPSITVVMATLAKSAAAHTIGILLATGDDGGQGVTALRAARAYAIAPAADGSGTLELGRGMAVQSIKPSDIADTVLGMCRG